MVKRIDMNEQMALLQKIAYIARMVVSEMACGGTPLNKLKYRDTAAFTRIPVRKIMRGTKTMTCDVCSQSEGHRKLVTVHVPFALIEEIYNKWNKEGFVIPSELISEICEGWDSMYSMHQPEITISKKPPAEPADVDASSLYEDVEENATAEPEEPVLRADQYHCPECGNKANSGFGLSGGGMGMYFFCTHDDCNWFYKELNEEGE